MANVRELDALQASQGDGPRMAQGRSFHYLPDEVFVEKILRESRIQRWRPGHMRQIVNFRSQFKERSALCQRLRCQEAVRSEEQFAGALRCRSVIGAQNNAAGIQPVHEVAQSEDARVQDASGTLPPLAQMPTSSQMKRKTILVLYAFMSSLAGWPRQSGFQDSQHETKGGKRGKGGKAEAEGGQRGRRHARQVGGKNTRLSLPTKGCE